jgi:hypothetical protein
VIRDREAQLNQREELLNRREAQVEKEEKKLRSRETQVAKDEEKLRSRKAHVEKEEEDVRKARTLHIEAVRCWGEYMEAREKSLQLRNSAEQVEEVVSASESEHSAQRPNW